MSMSTPWGFILISTLWVSRSVPCDFNHDTSRNTNMHFFKLKNKLCPCNFLVSKRAIQPVPRPQITREECPCSTHGGISQPWPWQCGHISQRFTFGCSSFSFRDGLLWWNQTTDRRHKSQWAGCFVSFHSFRVNNVLKRSGIKYV